MEGDNTMTERRTYEALRAEVLQYGYHVDTPTTTFCFYCGTTERRTHPRTTPHAADCLWLRLTRDREDEQGG